jgi:hypothetical protein
MPAPDDDLREFMRQARDELTRLRRTHAQMQLAISESNRTIADVWETIRRVNDRMDGRITTESEKKETPEDAP